MDENLLEMVEKTVSIGENLGVDLIIVRGVEKIDNQIRFSQNKIDINKQWNSKILEFCIVVEGNHLATGELTPSSVNKIQDQIKKSIKFAKTITSSPFFKGIESNRKTYKKLEGYFDSKISDYREKAPDYVNASINAAIDSGAKRVAGSYLFGVRDYNLKSSAGPEGSYSGTYYNLTVRAFQNELDASGQGLACGRIPSSASEQLVKAGNIAGNFSKLHRGAKQTKAGKYDVIMSPAVAANLLGKIPLMADPLKIMIGYSALGDKVGETIGPENVTVVDDGLRSDGLGSSPFDFEGTPRSKTPIISNGVLTGFIHNTSTAKIADGKSTGNSELVDPFEVDIKQLGTAPTNCIFNNGDNSFDELLETSNPTIYVTCNWYTRYTSRISTEFSTIPRDAAFLVQKGELSTPLKNFRISDNLLRQFANIDAIATDLVQVNWWEVETPTFIPHMRVRNCRITTATQ